MPIATFRGEGSVEEIADRLFTGLTPKQREVATEGDPQGQPAARTAERPAARAR